MQEPCFFMREGKNLFGIYYPPRGQPKEKGFVLCNAFGKEYILSLSFLTNFARELASRGFPVFRFDYLGYGDSEGCFEEATVSSMQADIESAMEELRRHASIQSVGLIGLRFGGTLATLVAAKRPEVQTLVLWEPIPKAWDYIYGELRQTVTMQTVLFREIRITREQIVGNILAGQPSISEGYNFNCIDEGFPLGAAFIQEAQQLDLLDHPPPAIKARTLVLHVNKKPTPAPKSLSQFVETLTHLGTPCQIDVATETLLPWKQEPVYATRSPNLFSKTMAWIEEN